MVRKKNGKNTNFRQTGKFFFGTATAAYQIEGAAAQDGRGQSVWDAFSRTPGKIKPGHTGDVACDHYNRSSEDIRLMGELGVNAYRFSAAWPRILPEGRGAVNQAGVDFYSRFIDELLEAGITPFLTMFHWDLPLALQKEYGGFSSRRSVQDFGEYAELLVQRFGDRVKHWITLNEPWVYAIVGNLLGVHAPGKKNPWTALRTLHNLLLAHGEAVKRVRSFSGDSEVGITLNLLPVYPHSDRRKDKQAAAVADQFVNSLLLDPILKGSYPEELWKRLSFIRPKVKSGDMDLIHTPIDFLGINNYTRERARYRLFIPLLHLGMTGLEVPPAEFVKDGVQHTSMGWEVYPEGLYELLTRIRDEYGNKPVYITENGAAFEDDLVDGEVHDTKRIEFLEAYTAQVERAVRDGCDVRGYFVWTLLDNFEWAEGYDKRFGLVYVDYQDGQRRIIKDSGLWYRDYIKKMGGP
ncbi:MAG: GH1 family beta-glucosidase [Sediminispirochaetaceae bacterium]